MANFPLISPFEGLCNNLCMDMKGGIIPPRNGFADGRSGGKDTVVKNTKNKVFVRKPTRFSKSSVGVWNGIVMLLQNRL